MPVTMTKPVAMEQPDRMWTVKEVAVFLNYKNVRTIYRMAERGELPAYWLNGSWRFKEDEIRAWVEERKRA